MGGKDFRVEYIEFELLVKYLSGDIFYFKRYQTLLIVTQMSTHLGYILSVLYF